VPSHREHRHRLCAPGDDDLCTSGANPIGRHGDRLQTGGAESVDRHAGDHIGQACSKRRNARHVHSGFRLWHRAAEDHIIYVVLANGGISLHECADDRRSHVIRARVAQCSFICLADRRAQAIDYHGLVHRWKW
jgi:hypothetical protein